ncbi:uncharacterized protein APUU_30670A [Aspergillus puulaauensis]|uniref:Uncharacterized protein n=1 Tax=Aspergillus puulaauensis TaxID=1220207 RepID=A0A7R7XJ69_9EURO|nr:uncharacterized protein APUU_30670A [Aspergillus puulaauensis]BCS22445.1 hypothetical protein APUU_30670A [Aspergillus puulaauensis]
MALSTEATVGIVALLVASIPIAFAGLKYWKRARHSQSNDPSQGYILPRFHTPHPLPQRDHNIPIPMQLLHSSNMHQHSDPAIPLRADSIHLTTRTTVSETNVVRRLSYA